MKRTGKRKEALASGAVHYTTDRPCRQGHSAPRLTSSGSCVLCNREKARRLSAIPGNRARINERSKVRRQNPDVAKQISSAGKRKRRADPRHHMLALARRRAKRSGTVFALALEDIVVPKRCPVLGFRLRVGRGKATYCSPTLDRIISGHGYIRGNVAVISAMANSIKQNAQPHEVEAVARWMRTVWPPHLQ